MGAYLDVLLHANPKIFLEAKIMVTKTKKRKQTLEEVFTEAGLIPEWIARGKAEGIALGEARGEAKINEVVKNLHAMKMPIEMIARAVQMPVKKVNALVIKNEQGTLKK